MLSNHIEFQIYNNFPYTPTIEQKFLIKSLSAFISGEDSNEIFILNGYAGTGKTTIVTALSTTLNSLKIKNLMIAPTGRAAKVMSQYSCQKAVTIHKKIFRQKSATSDNFILGLNRERGAFFIVDESSMIANGSFENSIFGSGRLLDDIFEYVKMGQNCKIIIIGDTAQLPPIGTTISPALNPHEMERYGDLTYFNMQEVVRQELHSGILRNATIIRSLIDLNKNEIPKFDLSHSDTQRISGNELLEVIEDCYNKFGITSTIAITRSNKQANRFNQGIRSRVLYQEEMIDSGDYIMIVKNNYFYNLSTNPLEEQNTKDDNQDFIANGDTAQILRIKRYEEIHGFKFADVTIKLISENDFELDCKVLLDTLYSDSPSLNTEENRRLFESVEQDYTKYRRKTDRYKAMRNDPYLNALQIKFAYAITCHKAQGGQWDCVIIDKMLWGDNQMSSDLLRWLYTAVTRATKKLYLLNFDERFFDE